MAEHNELGQLGEQLAARLLEGKGYTLLARNWRYNRAEIDLIAKVDEVLVFVEVKTRSTDAFGPPDAFVSARKKRLMAGAATAYMAEVGHEWEFRFDIISIVMRAGQSPSIVHYEDAFFPGAA